LAPREEALSAGNVAITGHGGDEINAYQVVAGEDGPRPGVLVIHHLPGWDSPTKEVTRRFAAHGYNAICPNLYAREGLDVDADDAAAAARAKGGVPDEQFLGTRTGRLGPSGPCPTPTARWV
jgi:carboxymethylenebutenolidase